MCVHVALWCNIIIRADELHFMCHYSLWLRWCSDRLELFFLCAKCFIACAVSSCARVSSSFKGSGAIEAGRDQSCIWQKHWLLVLPYAALQWSGNRCRGTSRNEESSVHIQKRIMSDSVFHRLRSNFQKPTSKNLQCAVLESWMLLICRKLHWLPTAGSCCSLCDTGFVWQLQSFLFQH